MNKNIVIELSTSQQDWELVRECYVQSFRRYPLYKYMVPDDNKRDAFLRAYLNANYEVTVANGNGILLVLKIFEEELDNMAVEGGILFVFPSDDGHGWAITDDEPYWEAYEKYGLAKISPDGLERVKRYEAWENENICKKLTVNRIPMWNGLFCAISPKHASKGLGSTLWKDGMKILKEYFIKRAVSRQLNKATKTSAKHKGFCTKLSKELVSNHMHYSTLLNHRKTPDLSAIQDLNGSLQKESLKNDQKTIPQSAPIMVGISHCERSANFYEANGFRSIFRTPYCDPNAGGSLFYTQVLLLDPFRTGKENECREALAPLTHNQKVEAEMEKHHKIINPQDKLLVN